MNSYSLIRDVEKFLDMPNTLNDFENFFFLSKQYVAENETLSDYGILSLKVKTFRLTLFNITVCIDLQCNIFP